MTDPLPLPQRAHRITTPDDIGIAVQEWGAPDGRGVLFIHGFSQCGLCWGRQTASAELAHLRMVTFDFRGHGASDKPADPQFYQDPRRWADEVAAVIAATGLDRPILVGWSYAGRIICDYVATHGTAGIGGIMFVDAVASNAREFYGSCNRLMRQMCSPDTAENIAATRAFLRRCFAREVPQDLFESMLGFNMMVPAAVRAALFGRTAEYDAVLAGLDVPVLVVHGARDEVVAPAMAHHIAATVPGARLDLYQEAGHAPFVDAPDAFNAALAAFARRIAADRPA